MDAPHHQRLAKTNYKSSNCAEGGESAIAEVPRSVAKNPVVGANGGDPPGVKR